MHYVWIEEIMEDLCLWANNELYVTISDSLRWKRRAHQIFPLKAER